MVRTRRSSSGGSIDPEVTTPTASAFGVSASRTPITLATSKSVILNDWWLVKPEEEKGIAVAGFGSFASRETLGARFFCSAPICERNDTTTLETVDGVTVTITGLINRHRAHENGFSFEICNHFLIGFPYNWRDYVNQCCGEEMAPRGFTKKSGVCYTKKLTGSSANNSMPIDLNKLSAIELRDLVMNQPEDFVKPALDDILGNLLNVASKDSQVGDYSKPDNRDPGDGTPLNVKSKHEDDSSVGATTIKREAPSPSRGVVTRSMSSRRNVIRKN